MALQRGLREQRAAIDRAGKTVVEATTVRVHPGEHLLITNQQVSAFTRSAEIDAFRRPADSPSADVLLPPSSSAEAPRENLTGDTYFTDGLRAVAFLSASRVPADEVKYLDWEPLPNQ